jgi:ParB-like chromosome segregation protein Spo0J
MEVELEKVKSIKLNPLNADPKKMAELAKSIRGSWSLEQVVNVVRFEVVKLPQNSMT